MLFSLCTLDSQDYRDEMNGAVFLLVSLLGLLQGVIQVKTEQELIQNSTLRWELRLMENAIVINRLEQHLDRLQEQVKRKPVDIESIYRRIENTVNRLEGTGCEDHEFQCGSIERECISKLLICDGVKDCVNGQDEDPSFCDVSMIRAGLTFSGWFTEGHCMHGSRRNLYHCQMRVTSVTRSHIFGSRLPMTMSSSCNRTVIGLSAEEDKTPFQMRYSVVGDYQIANRRWFSEAGGYSNYCQFPDASFSYMRCETVSGRANRCNSGAIAYRDE